MAILVLNRLSLVAAPYDAWAAEIGQPIVVLTSAERLNFFREEISQFQDRYAYIESFAQYELNGMVEYRAMELHKRFHFSHVVAMTEFDLGRAARLRRRFGLRGQDEASVKAFRDKLVMKNYCAEKGIPVGIYRPVQSAIEILEFSKTRKLPIVVKPRNGAAASGVAILRSESELLDYLGQSAVPSAEFEPYLMAEAFVAGDLYHVDGLVADGEILINWPSQYVNSNISFKDDVSLGSVTLAPENPLTDRLRDFTKQVLRALPTPSDTTFHAEIFHVEDDRLILCEIASRTGGGLIPRSVPTAQGLQKSLNEYWFRALCGLPAFSKGERNRDATVQAAGWILFPSVSGTVTSIPKACPYPWGESYRLLVDDGDVKDKAVSAIDYMASLFVTGKDEVEVRDRIAMADKWFWQSTVIEHNRS
ncbi:MAG TPA: hypothetical protein VHL08_06745 [Dongiaceae bacterium]|jgi:biotin carboxylase|nr:hypothetical protein [Dongiaceae bacterium]